MGTPENQNLDAAPGHWRGQSVVDADMRAIFGESRAPDDIVETMPTILPDRPRRGLWSRLELPLILGAAGGLLLGVVSFLGVRLLPAPAPAATPAASVVAQPATQPVAGPRIEPEALPAIAPTPAKPAAAIRPAALHRAAPHHGGLRRADVLAAHRALRRAYVAAAEAGVPRGRLAAIQHRWVRLRETDYDRPALLVARYAALTDQLRRTARATAGQRY